VAVVEDEKLEPAKLASVQAAAEEIYVQVAVDPEDAEVWITLIV